MSLISQNCIDLVKSMEGCKLKAYQDVGGVWTVGYGATGPAVGPSTVWTQQQADAALANNLAYVASKVNFLVKTPLNQNQKDSLASFAYNVGLRHFAKSTLLQMINQGELDKAADEFLKWSFVDGKKIEGLENRRMAERELFLTEE